MTEEKKNHFEILNAIDVSAKIAKKGNLNYLSWADAWKIAIELYPEATHKIYETETGCIYWTDGKTAWVKASVTIEGQERIEYLPVMDFRNAAIPLEKLTSMDVNKAIQRCVTKALGRHGLGLGIYQGEDFPDAGKKPSASASKKKYNEYLACLDRTTTRELWLQVKPKKDEWVSWAEENYSEEFSDQLNDKFLALAEKFEGIDISDSKTPKFENLK